MMAVNVASALKYKKTQKAKEEKGCQGALTLSKITIRHHAYPF